VIESMRGSERIHIDSAPEAVWKLISDVTRMGEWSPETQSAAWIGGQAGPVVGATFAGKNRYRWTRWTGKCAVTVAEPGREFTFVRRGPDGGTTWSYVLEPEDGGTNVTESFCQARVPGAPLRLLGRVLFGADRERRLRAGVRTTLERLKATAENETTG
jgi:hypothetical protein